MPASGNKSNASMYAEPTIPNISLTPFALSVSTNASLPDILTDDPNLAFPTLTLDLRKLALLYLKRSISLRLCINKMIMIKAS